MCFNLQHVCLAANQTVWCRRWFYQNLAFKVLFYQCEVESVSFVLKSQCNLLIFQEYDWDVINYSICIQGDSKDYTQTGKAYRVYEI